MVPWFRSQSCANQDGCLVRVFPVGGGAVPYRRCWTSLGGTAHRTWSRTGSRRWTGSAGGGSLVAHSPAVEANTRVSSGPDGRQQGFRGDAASRDNRGEMRWGKDQSVVLKGSDAIHARTRRFYMQLLQIHFAPACAPTCAPLMPRLLCAFVEGHKSSLLRGGGGTLIQDLTTQVVHVHLVHRGLSHPPTGGKWIRLREMMRREDAALGRGRAEPDRRLPREN